MLTTPLPTICPRASKALLVSALLLPSLAIEPATASKIWRLCSPSRLVPFTLASHDT